MHRDDKVGDLSLDDLIGFIAYCFGYGKGHEVTLSFTLSKEGQLRRFDAHEGPLNLQAARDRYAEGRDTLPAWTG